jgi:hypothetical protein
VRPGHLRCPGIWRIRVVDDKRQAFGAAGWFQPGKRRRSVLTFAGVDCLDFAALGEAGEVRLKVMDEALFASALAGSIVNRSTSMAAVRRRSLMLRPMDEPGTELLRKQERGTVTRNRRQLRRKKQGRKPESKRQEHEPKRSRGG